MEIDSSPGRSTSSAAPSTGSRWRSLHLLGEKDEASRERLEALRQTLADKSEQLAALNARWEAEKSGLFAGAS